MDRHGAGSIRPMIYNLSIFLKHLGQEMLSEIATSGEPLSFVYNGQLVLVRIDSQAMAEIEQYDTVKRMFFVRKVDWSSRQHRNFQIKDIKSVRAGASRSELILDALYATSADFRDSISRSRESITFSCTNNNAEMQVEVIPMRGGGSLSWHVVIS